MPAKLSSTILFFITNGLDAVIVLVWILGELHTDGDPNLFVI